MMILDSSCFNRSVLIQFTGWILIFVCLAFPILTLYMAFDPLPTPHWIVIAPIAIGACCLAVRQFRALYCCPPIAARPCSIFLSFLAAFLLVGAVTFHFEGLPFRYMIGTISVGMLLILLDVAAALIVRRNSRKAVADGTLIEGTFDKFYPMFQNYRKTEFIGFTFMILSVAFATTFFVCKFHVPAYGEHLPFEKIPFDGLPNTGSDFTFKRDHRNWLRCEFTISEKDFKRWVSSEKHWTGYENIERYSIPPRARLSDDRDYIDGFRALPEIEGGPNAIFDLNTNRANYWKYSIENRDSSKQHGNYAL